MTTPKPPTSKARPSITNAVFTLFLVPAHAELPACPPVSVVAPHAALAAVSVVATAFPAVPVVSYVSSTTPAEELDAVSIALRVALPLIAADRLDAENVEVLPPAASETVATPPGAAEHPDDKLK